MISCKLGFHEWMYAYESTVRWCKKCKKKQEISNGKWMDTHLIKRAVDNTKYCECPRDYTISIRQQLCPHCGLPRRPRALPKRSEDAARYR